ncbi:DUF1353 domain-containing protein [Pseudooceanicola onchidii]|uniref:DUF1353 domain-containing protein n=1 Tax=Pseudooceanicola onchidii TaxID=2562279 RepID=UPI00145B4A33|nr:DUF1353 domain-containing protein [Pseudooceanicola onchidii]
MPVTRRLSTPRLRLALSIAAWPLLAACVPPPDSDTRGATFCTGAAGTFCAFVNAPLQLASDIVRLPRRPYPFQPLAQDLNFVDARQQTWIAPKGILTDGASIPPVFVSVVGRPTDPAFAKAAAIHDSYCGVGNEATPYYHTRPWQATHRMFYEALRVGGASEKTAKTLYAAVYMGGPRWLVTRPHPVVSTQGTGDPGAPAGQGIERPDLAPIPQGALQDALRDIIAEIEARNPGIGEIERLVDQSVGGLRSGFARSNPSSGDPDRDPDTGSGIGDTLEEGSTSDELAET